jgi:Uncharacterized protein conserved in bacteria
LIPPPGFSRNRTGQVGPNRVSGEKFSIDLALGPAAEHIMDALTLSALIGSRICHDTLTPVGSINNGFEILDDPTTPEEMKKASWR